MLAPPVVDRIEGFYEVSLASVLRSSAQPRSYEQGFLMYSIEGCSLTYIRSKKYLSDVLWLLLG
jgi:hypothetical protein